MINRVVCHPNTCGACALRRNTAPSSSSLLFKPTMELLKFSVKLFYFKSFLRYLDSRDHNKLCSVCQMQATPTISSPLDGLILRFKMINLNSVNLKTNKKVLVAWFDNNNTTLSLHINLLDYPSIQLGNYL